MKKVLDLLRSNATSAANLVASGLRAAVLGLLFGHVGMTILGGEMESTYHYDLDSAGFLNEELMLVPGVMVVCIVASLIPAISAFRTDIARTLSDA